MFKVKFGEITKYLLVLLLGVILSSTVLDFNDIPLVQRYIWIAIGASLIFVALFIVWVSVLIIRVVYKIFLIIKKLIYEFFTKPNPKNLRLYPGRLNGNVFTLKFVNTEWRYINKQIESRVDIYPFKTNHQPVDKMGRLAWTGMVKNSALPRQTNRFTFYEVDFLEIDPKDNIFFIKTFVNKDVEFPPGIYGFSADSYSNMYTISLGKINAVHNEILLLVEYKGGLDISVKNTGLEMYTKNKWNNSSQKYNVVHGRR